jgi:hypothetical protein
MKASKLLFLVAALVLASGALLAGNSTKLYKWVDKDGVTHYGSVIPPEYAKQQTEQLNTEGLVVKTTAAQKTPEQLAAEAQAQQQVQQQAKMQADQQAHDKVLLDTYTSVQDIGCDRDSKLLSVDAQINVLNGSITGLESTLADYQDRAKEFADKDKPVPPDVQKQLDTSQQQLVTDNQLLQTQKDTRQKMANQFIADIARYRELTGIATQPGDDVCPPQKTPTKKSKSGH